MKMLIAGEWISTPETVDVINPYTGEVIDTTPSATIEDAERAITSAHRHKKIMAKMPRHLRAGILDKAASIIEDRAEEFARRIVSETGKTITEGRRETARCVNTLHLSASSARAFHGQAIPFDSMESGVGKVGYYRREPLGVILCITPFNDPLNLVAHKLGPAIASGNTVVLKPSEMAPLSAISLCEVLIEAGLPPLALNVITGSGKKLSDPLIKNDVIKMISLTGGVVAGKNIAAAAGMVRMAFELGGCGSCIVMDDGDIDKAVKTCVSGAFAAAGENCVSVQRVLVHASIFDEFEEKFITAAKNVSYGDPMREDTEMGTMISAAAATAVQQRVEEAVVEGATVHAGNVRDGALYAPTVLSGIKRDAWLSTNEIFGPVVALYPFEDFDDAKEFSNAPGGAIHMAIFTSNINHAYEAFGDLEASMVLINESTDFRIDAMPFGGAGSAGLGREGVKFSMEEMTEPKAICVSLG